MGSVKATKEGAFFGKTFEMLSFELSGQVFGINVFKVKEIVRLSSNERFTSLPYSHPYVRGLKNFRDFAVPVIDTNKAIAKRKDYSEPKFLLILELANEVKGLMVDEVNIIEHVPWSDVEPAPKSVGRNSFVTSIAKVGEKTIPILDVEKIISAIEGESKADLITDDIGKGKSVLIVDDSMVAYKQVAKCAESLGFDTYRCSNGESGLEHLKSLVESGIAVSNYYSLVIIDIEMPKMDGYQLTAKIRQEEGLKDLRVMINSSLSNNISKDTAYRAGADLYLSKFDPDAIQSALKDAVSNANVAHAA